MRFLLSILLFCWALAGKAQNTQRDLSREVWTFHQQDHDNKYPASVPGTIHTDLLANELIPDPFFGDNEQKLQWIDGEVWVYETSFSISAAEKKHQNIALVFDGLDTYAEVRLNEASVIVADNMFRTWRKEVRERLTIGVNRLQVIFKPVAGFQKTEAAKLGYALPESHRVFTRKAQYHFGWDWGPKFLTCGIWKPVTLQFSDDARFENIRYEQLSLTDAKAELNFIATVYCLTPGKYGLIINGEKRISELKKGINTISIPYSIHKPKRWWCNGLGDAFLYPFTVSVTRRDKTIDTKKLHIGLRTIELMQEKDAAGTGLYFRLNGIPVFMKGANYIPPDSFLPRVKDSVYQKLVADAKLANMNMLRVWGGGVYADDAFYEACDRNGVLVWQDFMFACAMYPGDEKFLANVKHEVIDNVSRLQNHPSVALWCGNNENDEGWHNWGWQKQLNYSRSDSSAVWAGYKKLFHEVIPQTLDSLLPKEKNRYWPSSPSIGWGRKESLLQGDSHYWGVWWGNEPFDVYEKKVGRFMSEYGFQGMPPLETFRKFASENELDLGSTSVRNHQKHPTGYETIDTYMARDFMIPEKFDDYIYVSQLLQAEGMKTAIEAHRPKKPYCMGSLYWQLNDCWPVTSWSSVDYFGNWKAFHYQAKRSFENQLLSTEVKDGKLSVFIVNDQLRNLEGVLKADLVSFDGKILWSDSKPVTIPSNSANSFLEIDRKPWEEHSANAVFRIHFDSGGPVLSTLHYLAKPKDLKLPKPNVALKWTNNRTLEISTDVLAKNIYLSADGSTFSDNYFDLLPGEKKIVTVSKKVEPIAVKTLYDTIETGAHQKN